MCSDNWPSRVICRTTVPNPAEVGTFMPGPTEPTSSIAASPSLPSSSFAARCHSTPRRRSSNRYGQGSFGVHGAVDAGLGRRSPLGWNYPPVHTFGSRNCRIGPAELGFGVGRFAGCGVFLLLDRLLPPGGGRCASYRAVRLGGSF